MTIKNLVNNLFGANKTIKPFILDSTNSANVPDGITYGFILVLEDVTGFSPTGTKYETGSVTLPSALDAGSQIPGTFTKGTSVTSGKLMLLAL